MKKINGLKKAIGDYKRANAGGSYNQSRGELMFDTSDFEIWTDYLLGNEWKEYRSEYIVNIGKKMFEVGIYEINMKTVKEFVKENY